MNLQAWLDLTETSRADFARLIGVTGAAIWRLLKPGQFPSSHDQALRIVKATKGEVTPNDFLMKTESGFKGRGDWQHGKGNTRTATKKLKGKPGKGAARRGPGKGRGARTGA